MREYVLTFGDSLFADDVDDRIQMFGRLLIALFTVQFFGMAAGMVLLTSRVVAHANLILVNIGSFVLSMVGAARLGPQAMKFDAWWWYVSEREVGF